jgi:hypothetical protein
MRNTLILLLLVFTPACSHTSGDYLVADVSSLPALGSQFSSSGIATVIFGNTDYWVRYKAVVYSIEVSGSTQRVIRIGTSDKAFLTPEGVQVGLPASALKVTSGHWLSPAGSECFFELPSGWEARVSAPLGPPPTPSSQDASLPLNGSLSSDRPEPQGPCPPPSGVVKELTLRHVEHDGA